MISILNRNCTYSLRSSLRSLSSYIEGNKEKESVLTNILLIVSVTDYYFLCAVASSSSTCHWCALALRTSFPHWAYLILSKAPILTSSQYGYIDSVPVIKYLLVHL
jgi:hypothetical protein